jgi:hypothetical protein
MKGCLLAAAGCSFIFLFAHGAAAKVVNMGTLSRTAVQQACLRSGGSEFGMRSEDSEYGCRTDRGTVLCAPDSSCSGFVGDLIPMTGNSVEAVLGISKRGGATRIGPVSPPSD